MCIDANTEARGKQRLPNIFALQDDKIIFTNDYLPAANNILFILDDFFLYNQL